MHWKQDTMKYFFLFVVLPIASVLLGVAWAWFFDAIRDHFSGRSSRSHKYLWKCPHDGCTIWVMSNYPYIVEMVKDEHLPEHGEKALLLLRKDLMPDPTKTPIHKPSNPAGTGPGK